mgnify:CR=1 FL=1|tara:strand:- start:479 stop:718 length:240 start_codon:yes stop_codon:yes gene_type:complete
MSKRVKDRETALEKVSPSMLKYLREVIDTPIEGRGLDAEIARKVNRSRAWCGQMKKMISKRLTRDELLEVCKEIMKEAA